jgi:hypothetical protein
VPYTLFSHDARALANCPATGELFAFALQTPRKISERSTPLCFAGAPSFAPALLLRRKLKKDAKGGMLSRRRGTTKKQGKS